MKISAQALTINYALDGPESAPVVTLSHSLAANLSMWEPQVSALRDRYRVLRYDTRGHGKTDAPGGAYTLEQLTDDLLALLSALRIERTHFVGLSMGGMIGQMLALKAPERVASLALCDTTSRIPAEARPMWEERVRTANASGVEPLVEATLARWFTAPFRAQRPDVVAQVREMIRSTPPLGYMGCCRAIAALDLTERLGAISVPTLVVVGEEDQGTPVAASREIESRIPGARLVVIPSAAHLANLEQPEAFNTALLAFLPSPA